MRPRLLLGAAACTVAFTAATSGTAHAATVHFDEPVLCSDDGAGSTTCSGAVGQYNTTLTPSGVTSLRGKGTTYFSYTTPQGSYSDARTYNLHLLWKGTDTQVFSYRADTAFPMGDQMCTETSHYHVTGGKVTFDRSTVECVTP